MPVCVLFSMLNPYDSCILNVVDFVARNYTSKEGLRSSHCHSQAFWWCLSTDPLHCSSSSLLLEQLSLNLVSDRNWLFRFLLTVLAGLFGYPARDLIDRPPGGFVALKQVLLELGGGDGMLGDPVCELERGLL